MSSIIKSKEHKQKIAIPPTMARLRKSAGAKLLSQMSIQNESKACRGTVEQSTSDFVTAGIIKRVAEKTIFIFHPQVR